MLHCAGVALPCLCLLQAMIMTDPADKLDPMSLLFYMSSFSVLLLLPTALILEPGVFGEVSKQGGGGGGGVLPYAGHCRAVPSPTAYGSLLLQMVCRGVFLPGWTGVVCVQSVLKAVVCGSANVPR